MQDYELIGLPVLIVFFILIFSYDYYQSRSKKSKEPKQSVEGTELDLPEEAEGASSIKELPKIKSVRGSKKPTVLYFHSKTCPGCRILAPELNNLVTSYGSSVNYVSYSIDENLNEMKSLAINYVPTVLVLDEDADLMFNLVGVKGGDAKAAAGSLRTEIDKLIT